MFQSSVPRTEHCNYMGPLPGGRDRMFQSSVPRTEHCNRLLAGIINLSMSRHVSLDRATRLRHHKIFASLPPT